MLRQLFLLFVLLFRLSHARFVYVSEWEGVDSSECGPQDVPCKTLFYLFNNNHQAMVDPLSQLDLVLLPGTYQLASQNRYIFEGVAINIVSTMGRNVTKITSSYGFALFNFNQCNVSISGITFEFNLNSEGVLQISDTTLDVSGCEFVQNNSPVILGVDSTISIMDSVFNENTYSPHMQELYYGGDVCGSSGEVQASCPVKFTIKVINYTYVPTDETQCSGEYTLQPDCRIDAYDDMFLGCDGMYSCAFSVSSDDFSDICRRKFIHAEIIYSCVQHEYLFGSAVSVLNSSLTVQRSSFGQNSGANGALLAWYGTLDVRESVFDSNSALWVGVNDDPENDTYPYIRFGGAVSAFQCALNVTQSVFLGNSAEQAGAVYVCCEESVVFIKNSTFSRNHAAAAGAIIVDFAQSVVIEDCSFKKNNAVQFEPGAVDLRFVDVSQITNCDFQENVAYVVSALIIESYGNEVHAELKGCNFRGNIAKPSGNVGSGTVQLDTTSGFVLDSTFENDQFDESYLYVINSTMRVENCSFSVTDSAIVTGGGISFQNGALEILHTQFRGLKVSDGGGAIFAYESGSLLIDGCEFIENMADWGAAVATFQNGKDVFANVSIKNCIFMFNVAHNGAIIEMYTANVNVANTTLDSNIGSGLSLQTARCSIENCLITNNSGVVGGGLLFGDGDLTVIDSVISSNNATDGGGIYFVDTIHGKTDLVIQNTLFANNSASKSGGGLLIRSLNEQASSLINSSRFVHNFAGLSGGAVAIFAGHVRLLDNNVVENNTAGDCDQRNGGGFYFDEHYCDDFSDYGFGNSFLYNSGDNLFLNGKVDCDFCAHCEFIEVVCQSPEVIAMTASSISGSELSMFVSLRSHESKMFTFPVLQDSFEIRAQLNYSSNATETIEICIWPPKMDAIRDSRSWHDGCLCVAQGNLECIVADYNGNSLGATVWASMHSSGTLKVDFNQRKSLLNTTSGVIFAITGTALFVIATSIMWGYFKKRQREISATRLRFEALLNNGDESIVLLAKFRGVHGKRVVVKIYKQLDLPKHNYYLSTFDPHYHLVRTIAICRNAVKNGEVKKLLENEVRALEGYSERSLAIVLEYFLHGDLETYLSNVAKPVPEIETVSYAIEAAKALQDFHNLDFIHRDYLLRNIFLDQNTSTNKGRLAVGDFDLARSTSEDDLYDGLNIRRLPCTRAPETFRDVYTRESDVFQFGFFLYELLHACNGVPIPEREWGDQCFKYYHCTSPDSDKHHQFLFEKFGEAKRELCLDHDFEDFVTPRLRTIIAHCVTNERSMRPSVRNIIDALENYRAEMIQDGIRSDDPILLPLQPAPELREAKYSSCRRYCGNCFGNPGACCRSIRDKFRQSRRTGIHSTESRISLQVTNSSDKYSESLNQKVSKSVHSSYSSAGASIHSSSSSEHKHNHALYNYE